MRFSIVIPTYERRDVITRNVRALERQQRSDFEVIVVDDGSTDGTAAALRGLNMTFPLIVIEQPNLGAGAARDAGATVATGQVLLFLDDDMEADPHLLTVHDRQHASGADVVVGDLPLHPESPRNLLSWGVGFWARERRARLMVSADEIEIGEMLTGQLSIARETYERLGGFDGSFTREGLFGGEDTDFGYRARQAGLRVVFDPEAVTHQYYNVDPGHYLRREFEAARSSHELLLKYPDQADRFGSVPDFKRRRDRWLLMPFVVAPGWVSWPLRAGVTALARTGHLGPRLRTLFFAVRTMQRFRGLRQARRATSTGRVLVLAYHGIAEESDDPVLEPYLVTPAMFGQQLDALLARGWRFVDLDTVLAGLAGERTLPRRAALLTFDDGYTDFIEAALPGLTARAIPAVVFAVAALIGASNVWDQEIGARPRQLMERDQLLAAARAGVSIGSHGLSHHTVATMDASELYAEIHRSADQLEALGLPRPKVFSYPYGEVNDEAPALLRRSGYEAAFIVGDGVVDRAADRYRLPRIQVLAEDTADRLRLRLAVAAWPPRWRDWLLRAALKLRRTRA